MAFVLNKILVSIDNMQFMNSSLHRLVKKLSSEGFKYLVEEFGSENLKLLKQKGDYPYEYMNSFERFNEEKSSNVIKVIRPILNFLVFFKKRFYTHQQHKTAYSKQKTKNAQKKDLKGY